jgi:NADPH:quinone reductase-like Zn-dependent oxidoreductase
MSQLVLTAIGGDPTDSIALNGAPDLTIGLDDVLVAIEAAPINRADLAFGSSDPAGAQQVPRTLGAEGVGRVLDAGPLVEPGLVGRRVLVLPSLREGTWGDQVVVGAQHVLPVSERADALQLAMLAGTSGAAWSLLHDYVAVEPGEWVGVSPASSGVGEAIIALARRAGINTLAIVRRDAAARQVRERGAELVLVDGAALGDRAVAALGAVRLRVLFDGGAQELGELARAVADGGSVVTFAAVTGRPPVLPLTDLFRGVSLRGFSVLGWHQATPRDVLVAIYGELTDLVEHGAIDTAVEATYPLESYREAIAHARGAGRSGKVLFTPGKRAGPQGTIQLSAAVDWR